ncbi:MAG: hypothetical protein V1826_01910 [bacterium]
MNILFVVVEGILLHPCQHNGFAMIARNPDGIRYVLVVDHGTVHSIHQVDEGTVVVGYAQSRFSDQFEITADSMGVNNFLLDPIFAAVIQRGWNPNHVSMRFCPPKAWSPSHPISYYSREQISAIPVKQEWDGSDEKYIIAPPQTAESPPAYAILVHLKDHMHIGIHAHVPQVYQDPVLTDLITAIQGLPDARSIPNLHPAALVPTRILT